MLKMEKGLFVHGLHRTCDVGMPIVERFIAFATRSQQRLEFWRKHFAGNRRTISPLQRHLVPVMAKEAQIECVGSILFRANDLPHGIQIARFAVGCQAHDLVFVAVLGKPEMLRDCLIEDAE